MWNWWLNFSALAFGAQMESGFQIKLNFRRKSSARNIRLAIPLEEPLFSNSLLVELGDSSESWRPVVSKPSTFRAHCRRPEPFTLIISHNTMNLSLPSTSAGCCRSSSLLPEEPFPPLYRRRLLPLIVLIVGGTFLSPLRSFLSPEEPLTRLLPGRAFPNAREYYLIKK